MNATRIEAAQIESLKAGLRSAMADPTCPVEFSPLLMECAQVLTRLAAADRLAPDTAASELADELQKLCCAETEGKFFDCVTDNIQTILVSLRRKAPDTAAAVEAERDANANLLTELMEEKPWKEKQWARCALAIGARAIKRGRLLTDREKLENLAKAFEDEGDKDIAATIRKAGRIKERGTA